MGVHRNIGYERFPRQGIFKDRKVEVCFGYDTTRIVKGVIVRNDTEDPFVTIIKLEDGRYVLATECQYHLI